MSSLSNLFWQPRATYRSPQEWAQATHEESAVQSLQPLRDSSSGPDWLLRLKGGKVIGDARLLASRQDDVIGQLQSLHGIEEPANHWTVRQKRMRWTVHLSGTSFLLGVGAGGNYYHWLFDCLPRLAYLARAGLSVETIDRFIVNETALPFHSQTLDVLGLPPAKRFHCSKRRVLTCETLLVPPMPVPVPGRIVPWVCEFLRASFLQLCSAKQPGRKLYLSRRGSPKRRLANEAAVEELFRQHGFNIISPGSCSFQEQVSAFANASCAAGPHGAAFANLVFAVPGTQVIEMFHPKHHSTLYADLAAQRAMRYRSVIGLAPDERAPDMSEKLGPYTVDLSEVKKLLETLN